MYPELNTKRRRLPPKYRGGRGMTLIELMIVVSVIAILGMIAVPSYQSYVMKARRADARGALTNAAQMLERCSTENPTTGYATPACTAGYPFNSENRHYRISLAAGTTASAYTLRAAPAAGGSQTNDPCGTYTLTQSGKRDVTGGTLTMAQCW
jgi:type IV pilus assembly protein PilE